MSALNQARGAASNGFWNSAQGWAAIAQAEALTRIADALEKSQGTDKGTTENNYYGVGGYGSQER